MKRKKDYSIPPQTATTREPQLEDVNQLKLHCTDGHGRLVLTLDFSEFTGRPLLAEHFMQAFRETQSTTKPITKQSNFASIRSWFRFLDVASVKVTDIKDLSTELIKEFVHWIDQHDWMPKTKHREYHGVKPLFLWLKREHKLHDLEVVTNPFPGVNGTSQPPQTLNETELEAVLRAAHAEIEQTWNDFQKGQKLLADYIPSDDSAEPDPRDLAAFLSHIKTRFGGIIPNGALLSGWDKTYFSKALNLHGGVKQVSRYLHATNESLTAYKIVIAAETFGNSGAVHHFRRDCSSAHPLLGNRTILSWEKGRSNLPQRRSFDHRKAASLPKLIDQVLLLTEPLVAHAHPADREYLFLTRTRDARGCIRAGLSCMTNNLGNLEAFCRRNDLRDDEGKLLTLNLAKYSDRNRLNYDLSWGKSKLSN